MSVEQDKPWGPVVTREEAYGQGRADAEEKAAETVAGLLAALEDLMATIESAWDELAGRGLKRLRATKAFHEARAAIAQAKGDA